MIIIFYLSASCFPVTFRLQEDCLFEIILLIIKMTWISGYYCRNSGIHFPVMYLANCQGVNQWVIRVQYLLVSVVYRLTPSQVWRDRSTLRCYPCRVSVLWLGTKCVLGPIVVAHSVFDFCWERDNRQLSGRQWARLSSCFVFLLINSVIWSRKNSIHLSL